MCKPPTGEVRRTPLLQGWVNTGKREGRSVLPQPGALAISVESLDDPRHLFAVVGTKRGGPQVASRAQFEQHGGEALVVWGLEYRDEVVRPHGPIDLLDALAPCFWASASAWSRRCTVSLADLAPWSVQFIRAT